MALEFRRRRFRKPGKKGQLALAITALVLAVCIATLWMIVHFHANRTPSSNDSSEDSSSATEVFTEEDIATMLVIFNDADHERFILIQADPADGILRTASVPTTLAVDENNTLVGIYRKNGAAAAVSAAVDALDLPIGHYVSISGEEAESWFNYLESGVTVTLEEAVDFTDTTGSFVRLDTGEHTLSGTQAACLLRYSGWKDAAVGAAFPAQLIAAMIDQYLYEARYLSSDFTQLANLTRTSLRIGDFNNYQAALEHLASKNSTGICEVISLYGNVTDDRFTFDRNETARHTELYG